MYLDSINTIFMYKSSLVVFENGNSAELKYSDVLDYRKQKAKEDKLREEEKLEEEKLKLERLKNDGVSSLKIDEDHELIELIEEI